MIFSLRKATSEVLCVSRDFSLAVSLISALWVPSNSAPCRRKNGEEKKGSYKTWRMNCGNLFPAGKVKLSKKQDISMTSTLLSQNYVKVRVKVH